MRILGVGVDMVQTSRLENADSNFLSKFLSEKELRELRDRNSRTLAGRFAAKEAIIKACSFSDSTVFFNDIEISSNEADAPRARLTKSGFGNVQILLSISHTSDLAIAFAIAVRDDENE